MQIRLYPHLNSSRDSRHRPVLQTVDGRAQLPQALSWLQHLPWDSALRGQSVAVIQGQRLPLHVSVAALAAGVHQARVDNPLVMLPVQHPLTDALRRAGYAATGRRRTYSLDLSRRPLHQPHRADLRLAPLTTEPDNLPLCQLYQQAGFDLVGEQLLFPMGQVRYQRAA